MQRAPKQQHCDVASGGQFGPEPVAGALDATWPKEGRKSPRVLRDEFARLRSGFCGPQPTGKCARHVGDSPFEESLGREAQTTHEIPEARVGPNRVECGLHFEPCQVYITIGVGRF